MMPVVKKTKPMNKVKPKVLPCEFIMSSGSFTSHGVMTGPIIIVNMANIAVARIRNE